MTVTASRVTRAPISVVPHLSSVDALATSAVDRSIAFAAERMEFSEPSFAVGHIRHGDRATCGYFQYALSKEIAEYLAAYDTDVTAVYSYEYDATAEDSVFDENLQMRMIHLIVRAQRKTSALSALIQAFDRALAGAFDSMLGLPGVAYVLDAQVVDDADMKNRTGYAALISSINVRPSLVWGR